MSTKYPKSDHYNGSSFLNPGVKVNKGLLEVLKWQMTKETVAWPKAVDNTATPQVATEVSENEISTTFINHATHLVQLKGLNLLTDPLFSKRASPLSWAGPKRVRRPGIELQNLPRIDVVLISHNHYDHMDKASIRELSEKFNPLFVTPIGNAEDLKNFGAKRVVELDWWQETKVEGSEVVVSVVPAQHWSKRSLFDTNKSLWGGFVVRSETAKFYFAGDTGYGEFFKEIAKHYGPMDLSLLPIGAYEPRWFMKNQHMNPEEAVQAHIDLQSRRTLGTHFGTFQLTDEGIDQPAKDLSLALTNRSIDPSIFSAPENGQTHLIRLK
jgi:L-ascorbate metabolism protein UlaG (beta-lactamase superfamily)